MINSKSYVDITTSSTIPNVVLDPSSGVINY